MTAQQRLLVIDPSVRVPEHEGVATVLAGWPGENQVLQPALCPGDGPGPGSGYELAGVVLMGSAASVHDQHEPWLQALSAWLLPIVKGEIELPLLAICFGHQLLASLSGGTVGFLRADREKDLGFRSSDLSSSRLLGDPRRLQVIVSHREVVESVPPELRVIGSRPGVAIDAIEHQHLPLLGVQFHPEARYEFCRNHDLDLAPVADRICADGDRLLTAFHRLALEPASQRGDGPLRQGQSP